MTPFRRVWQYVRMAESKVRKTVELAPSLAEQLRQFAYERRLAERAVIEAALIKYLPKPVKP